MQNEIRALTDQLNEHTAAVHKLVKALQVSAAVWSDKKYSELADEITKMTGKVSDTISRGDDLIHLLREYERCAMEEFDQR